jgi:hypothetical protein
VDLPANHHLARHHVQASRTSVRSTHELHILDAEKAIDNTYRKHDPGCITLCTMRKLAEAKRLHRERRKEVGGSSFTQAPTCGLGEKEGGRDDMWQFQECLLSVAFNNWRVEPTNRDWT